MIERRGSQKGTFEGELKSTEEGKPQTHELSLAHPGPNRTQDVSSNKTKSCHISWNLVAYICRWKERYRQLFTKSRVSLRGHALKVYASDESIPDYSKLKGALLSAHTADDLS